MGTQYLRRDTRSKPLMSHPRRIATLITSHLRRRYPNWERTRSVLNLVEILFYASLKTEESRGVFCTVVFVGSESQLYEGLDPERRLHRYIFIPLGKPISLTAKSLAKFSQAAPPWASCIAVREKDDRLEISGMFDQEIHYQNALNRAGEGRFFRPGFIQVEVSGTGALTVYDSQKLLAKLSQDTLATAFHDVLNEGPIAEGLMRYVDKLEKRVKARLQVHFKRKEVSEFLVDAPTLWKQTLSRILLGIRRLKHGGAVLLIPSSPTEDLSINYSVQYNKTEYVLERHLFALARWQTARAQMRSEFSELGASIPANLVQERRGAFNEQEDAKKAELGCAAFVSSLAGVDGLILLSDGLRVSGFGVEIKRRGDPSKVFSAGNPTGNFSRLKSLDLSQFGTRHRSMMRYCDHHPGSIGFVISQDGDVRAITKTKHGLLVWENIQLQEIEVEDQEPKSRLAVRKILARQRDMEQKLAKSLCLERIVMAKGQKLKQQFWIDRSGDPLKAVLEREISGGIDRVQICLNEGYYVHSAANYTERVQRDGRIRVEEEISFFEPWRLIRRTRKVADFAPESQVKMGSVKSKRVDLSHLDEEDTRPDSFLQQSEAVIRAVLGKRKNIKHPPSGPKGDSKRFSFIQSTTSPDGRYALGFSLEQPTVVWEARNGTFDFMRRHYYLENFEDARSNYVIDLETNGIVGETGCHYVGTRTSLNHSSCEVVWSQNSRFMVQHFHGKWHTVEATIVRVDHESQLVAINLVKPIKKRAFEFLQRTKNRAFRKYGFDRFAVSISCEKISDNGYASFEVLGEIPKFGDGDDTFSVVQRLRIIEGASGVILKFLDSRLGPRVNYM